MSWLLDHLFGPTNRNAQLSAQANAPHPMTGNNTLSNTLQQGLGQTPPWYNQSSGQQLAQQMAMQQPPPPRTLIEQQMDENARVDAVVRPRLGTRMVCGGGGGSALSQQLGNIYPGQVVIMPVGSTIQSIAISGMGQGASGGGSAYIGYGSDVVPRFPDSWLRMYEYERACEQVARMVEET